MSDRPTRLRTAAITAFAPLTLLGTAGVVAWALWDLLTGNGVLANACLGCAIAYDDPTPLLSP